MDTVPNVRNSGRHNRDYELYDRRMFIEITTYLKNQLYRRRHSMVEWKRRDRRMLPSPGDVPQLIRAADNHPRWHEAEERPPSVGQWHT
ncbi:hypothetical protein NPIL_223091 [Nephila pilipes]|uniref:Uncharacterized protein n=1 Tax=Nephila pilipes TaxID=299642 RepID=A0A8X6NTG5_NEPPI|nr:hypothetical protein NPIL_223091 [Nephila pilipes]